MNFVNQILLNRIEALEYYSIDIGARYQERNSSALVVRCDGHWGRPVARCNSRYFELSKIQKIKNNILSNIYGDVRRIDHIDELLDGAQ